MTAIFPTPIQLPGLTYPVRRTYANETIYAAPVSMRDVTQQCYTRPMREWQLRFSVLRQTATIEELELIAGFFLQRMGSYQAFWYEDPYFNTVTNGTIAAGNGVQTTFTFAHQIGPSYFEVIDQLKAVSAVRVNGILVAPADYTIVQPNQITFDVAPGFGLPIAADFTYYYLVRFSEDKQKYEQFMRQLYELQQCEFRSAPL